MSKVEIIYWCLVIVAYFYLFNFLFLRMLGLDLEFKKGLELTVPIVLSIFSGLLVGLGYDFLSDGIMFNQEMPFQYFGLVLVGYAISAVFSSRMLRQKYGIELTPFRCLYLNFQVLMGTKIVLLIVIVPFLFLLDSLA